MKKSIYLFAFFVISCSSLKLSIPDLPNSKWEWTLDDYCINSIEFSDLKYMEYNCELGEKWQGNYLVNRDTIILQSLTLDSNVPGKGNLITNISKMIYSPAKGLGLFYFKEWTQDGWQENYFEEPMVFYTRVKE